MCKKTKEQKFIMLPSVDFCFQELMEDEEVRRGFIGAFLRIPPEEILDMELLPKKLSGVYKHRVMNRKEPLVRGFDDVFMAPHSRYTQASRQQILDNPRLKVLADSDEAGIYIVLGDGGKEIFVMGHPEYDRLTLDQEYKRDIDKGIEPDLPVNYYPDDDCNRKPLLSWRSHANNLYTNWLNYYVYQITPYDLNESYDNYCI